MVCGTCRRTKRAACTRGLPPQRLPLSTVLVGLVGFKEPVATGAVQVVLELLCHKFPNVRKVAAEKLYVKMLIFEDSFLARGESAGTEVDVDQALEVLTETGWDAEEVRMRGVQHALRLVPCLAELRCGDAAKHVCTGSGDGVGRPARRIVCGAVRAGSGPLHVAEVCSHAPAPGVAAPSTLRRF